MKPFFAKLFDIFTIIATLSFVAGVILFAVDSNNRNGSWTRATQEAADKAKAYCAANGKQFLFITEQRTGVVGWSPQESSIAFDCVDANTKPAGSISF
ncbi:hypothetical protein G6711_00080 [Polynucleobacter paneuropaeus]|nr:hypothetical protein [Polynucleobacter paneuropaeus]